MKNARHRWYREPLFRLLAINLAAGIALAVLLTGAILVLDIGGLRSLIAADRSPGAALGLLLFGFVVTFGSVVMGSAIMALTAREDGGGGTTAREDGSGVPVAVRRHTGFARRP